MSRLRLSRCIFTLICLSLLTLNAFAQESELRPGGLAIVYVEDPTGLRVRAAPGIVNEVLDNLFNGEIVQIIRGPEFADGFAWWQLVTPRGITGWSVDSADGIRTLTPIEPSPTPAPTSTQSAVIAPPMTGTPSYTESLYGAFVDTSQFEVTPLLAFYAPQAVYNLAWSPSYLFAVAYMNGSTAFHWYEEDRDMVFYYGQPFGSVITLIGGPLAETIRYSNRQFVEISGASDPDNPNSQIDTVIYDYTIYDVGGWINDSPWDLPEDILETLEWIEPTPVQIWSACDDDAPTIEHAGATLKAGNPALFVTVDGDVIELGDGSGGIAWRAENDRVLLWSAIEPDGDGIATGTAEVWDIETGERLLIVPHANPHTTGCGIEARPAALHDDGSLLATVINTRTQDVILTWAISADENDR